MTPKQLAEIEARWAKATKGPWIADMRPVATECGECGEYAYEVPGVIRRKSDGCGIVDVQESEKQNENAAAIASAPTDIAWLLELVEQQQQKIERLKCCGNCEHWQYAWHSNGLDKRCRIKILKHPDRESKCCEWQGVE